MFKYNNGRHGSLQVNKYLIFFLTLLKKNLERHYTESGRKGLAKYFLVKTWQNN